MIGEHITVFLNVLTDLGVSCVVRSGDLDIKAPKGAITKEILDELKERKSEIIDYLLGVSVETITIESIENENGRYPISSAQRRLWVMSQFEEASVGHNMPNTVRLKGNQDVESLGKAIDAVVARHEILRTVFKTDHNGEVYQEVIPAEEFDFTLTFHDCRVHPEQAHERINADIDQPFDLVNGPLIRAMLLQVDDEEYIFHHNMHHIISDGWSGEVLSKDLFAYYDAFKRGIEVTNPSQIGLRELKIQYKDYAVWQLAQVESDNYKRHKEFWLDKLGGTLAVLDLPAYKQRPQVKTYSGENLSLLLPSAVTRQLKQYVDKNGGSQFMLILTVLNVLLFKYTKTKDIIIGSPVAGREHAEFEDQIGFYINTLVSRNKVDPNESFNAFYDRVKTDTLTAYQHQMYPFDKLVEELNLPRDTSRSVVFDVSLTYHNIYQESISREYGERYSGEVRHIGAKKVKNDIELHFQELGDYVSMDMFFNSDVYDQATMSNFMRHFQQIAESLLSSPSQAISHVSFLRPDEVEEQLRFNSKTIHYPNSDSLVQLFEKQVEDNPNNIAIVFKNKSWTYAELDQVSTQLANCLTTEYGVSKGSIVGVEIEKNDWAIVTILAILKSGGVYLPIDPNYPSNRKKFICEDSELNLLITQADHIYDIDYYEGKVFAVDLEFEPDNYADNLEERVLSNDLAYIIYTSGSTGLPKGVMIEHGAIANTIRAQIDCFETTAKSNGLLFASLSFDASISEIFTILSVGGQLSIISEEIRKSPKKLADFITENKISIATLPPSYLAQIEVEEISNLRKLITAGESANVRKAREFLKYGAYFNAYGPTETAICASIFKMENTPETRTISIGKPISNVEVYILNEHGQLHPMGVPGEICIGGLGLARGYLNNDDLTNEKFISSPFNSNKRVYRTGDLGRWLPDGNLEFIGRIDDQLKINGYRIEPGEIEHALIQCEHVKTAVVLPKTSNDGLMSLNAFVVPDEQKEINFKSIRSFLEKRLPAYMIPSEFIQLDELPLTVNGKVDKKALVKMTGKQLIDEVEFVAPESNEEKLLVGVLKQVLLRDRIGIHDSFYNLGGDSIKSIQVVGRLKQIGYVLTVEDILKTPEVKTLATLMRKVEHQSDQSEISGEVELAPIQHWFFDHKGINNHRHFNQSVLLKGLRQIDRKKLETCLVHLTTHHDVLRLSASHQAGVWKLFNRTSTERTFSLDVHDLREDENPDDVIKSIGEELQASFDLEKGPLIKLVLFQLKEHDLLGIIAHHLIVDGVSWRILLEDVQTLYKDAIQGLAPKLPNKTSSFQNWTSTLKTYSDSAKVQKERDYWERIGQTSVDSLPTNSSTDQSDRSTVAFNLGESYSEQLQTKVHHVYKTQVNDLLLTALGLSLKDTFGVQTSVIQMEGHGREDLFDRVDLSRTVGWFTSIYPFLLDVSNCEKVTDALVQVKDELRRVPNKGIGYGVLAFLAEEKLRTGSNPQINFNFLGDFGSNPGGDKDSLFEYANQDFGLDIAQENNVSALLDVSGIIVEGNLNISVTYPINSIEPELMLQFIKAFETNLIDLIDTLSATSRSYLTASDLTYKGLTSNEWNALDSNNMEDMYELSPLQNGIFFHWLTQESNSIYFEQTNYRVHAPQLDKEKLKEAYCRLIERHAVLRTSFSNEISDRPLQIVHKEVPIHFSYEKLDEGIDPQEYLNQFKERDMEKGFDLTVPSQMRLQIIELSNNRYEFIWSHHHILMDGWCISLLINDFNALLNQKNDEAALPVVTKYANYIEWLGRIDQHNSLRYWKDYLSGYDQAITFPCEQERSERARIQMQETLEIKDELFKDIIQLCNDLEITTSTFIQCAWGILLSQYNNSKDVVFGKVVSGRPGELRDVENIIGLFINTVPVRVSYKETDTPIDVLQNMQHEAIQGSNHHYINLSEVQAQSELGMNLINHVMIYQNYAVKSETDVAEGSNEDFQVESMEVFEQSNYDLNVVVGVAANSLTVHLRYDSNRFNQDGMKRMVNHLRLIVDGLVNRKDVPVSTISCLPEQERNHLLVELNNTRRVLPNETILEMFQHQVGLTPENRAVSFKNEQITYAHLDRLSNRFANYLKSEEGVRKGDFVEVKLPRTEWILPIILGIWKAGGVYVPVDPEYPDFRIDYIENDANCKVIVDTNQLNTFQSIQENYSDETILNDIHQADLAYVIYTSGSTGKPKGTLISHGNLFEFLKNCTRKYPSDTRIVQPFVASISFDISLFQMFYPLVTGGESIVVEKETFQNPDLFRNILSKSTVFDTVPAMFGSIVDVMLAGHEPSKLPSINRLFIGGDRIPNQLLKKLRRVFNNAEIVVTYGPTEATICSTGYFFEFSSEYEPNGAIIGQPNDNCSIYIVNENLDLQPKGVIGEICIGGAGVGQGYLNRADLTADKFIKNPFLEGGRMYRTGDLGRWTHDNQIEFIGRLDDQVKVRGYRIELGEIEYTISQIENVEQVVVIAIDHPKRSEKELVAYLTLNNREEVEFKPMDMRAELQEKLPDYMVPAHFVELASIPLTANGKVDRKSLPAIDALTITSSTEYVAPETEIEKRLVEIWESVLERKNIGIQDDFFELGGHSLKALRLIMSIKKEFDLKLEIKQLFQNTTILLLAKEIDRIDWLSKSAEEDESNLDIIEI